MRIFRYNFLKYQRINERGFIRILSQGRSLKMCVSRTCRVLLFYLDLYKPEFLKYFFKNVNIFMNFPSDNQNHTIRLAFLWIFLGKIRVIKCAFFMNLLKTIGHKFQWIFLRVIGATACELRKEYQIHLTWVFLILNGPQAWILFINFTNDYQSLKRNFFKFS